MVYYSLLETTVCIPFFCSRRSDREDHPVYGSHNVGHQGLGRYNSLQDQTRMHHLSPDHM